jgi:hypothetical protein
MTPTHHGSLHKTALDHGSPPPINFVAIFPPKNWLKSVGSCPDTSKDTLLRFISPIPHPFTTSHNNGGVTSVVSHITVLRHVYNNEVCSLVHMMYASTIVCVRRSLACTLRLRCIGKCFVNRLTTFGVRAETKNSCSVGFVR